ncbi:MAG: transcriptional repressor [Spirochaetaceae bacterium]|nr:MAG: transcriptional repressor [Spirochaetaceae bacterium]
MNKTIVTGPPAAHSRSAVQLLAALEAAGKRNTAQRYAICRALEKHAADHPTVAEIYAAVRESFPMISQATVYNTLQTLKRLGVVIELDIANHDHIHYDLDVTPHVNVVCRHCENIADLHMRTVTSLIDEAAARSGFQIQRTAGLILYGVCPDCRRRRGDGRAAQEGEPQDA